MNEAFEKILKKIKEKRNKYQRLADGFNFDGWNEEDIKYSAKAEMCEELKEIVHEVAKEYHDGWIPCSYRLPEIGQEVIVATKNGSVYSNIYYDYIDNNAKEPCFHRWDDEMWNCFMLDVIAWQPLPKLFKERD